MIVTSSTTASQVYATNKTATTKATSAYESTTTPTQTQQNDQNTEIQKKEEPAKTTAEVQNDTKEQLTTQQELEIKQQVAQTMSETEESPLATAIQESSQTQSVEQTKATGKLAEMQEKYKDVYTPIPETYSKADEDLQTQKIHEAYPDYIDFRDFLKLVDKFYDGPPKRLGDKFNQEVVDKEKIAFQKAYDLFGGEEEYMSMMKGAMEIMQKYPVNTWGKDERVHNETELARFTNAAVYEGLESGKSVGEAKKDAINIRDSFMNMDFMREQFAKGAKYEPDPIIYDPYHALWDLRANGIDGRWEDNKVYENDNAMISELNKKISQFNFMLNNKGVIEKAENALDPSCRGRINTYQSEILDDKLPKVQMALDIFKNYKIYDSIDVKG
jgi:hypothetical protein